MNRIYKSLLFSFFLVTGSFSITLTSARSGMSPGDEQVTQKAMPRTVPHLDVNGNIIPDYLINKNSPDYIPQYPEFTKVKAYEKWEITSSRPAENSTVDPKLSLTSKGFIRFLDGTHIQFRLNEFSPVQNGEVVVTPQRLEFEFYKEGNCSQCIKRLYISRKSEEDKEFLLEFDGMKQLFTVNRVKIQK